MKTKQIRISIDKNGKEMAYQWADRAKRFIKVSLEQAKIDIAAGQAVQMQDKGGVAIRN